MTPPADDNATALLARPTRRDDSIESLVALHDRDVRSALRRVLGRSQEEDDLVQEVFTRLVVRLRQPGDVCVGAWVRGVAHNLAVDEIRRRRPVPVEDVRLDRQVASMAEDLVAGSDLYSRLVQGANGLPDRQRAALAAALSSDGVTAVASHLGVSVHAAESLLSRARVRLRSHLAMSDSDDRGSVRVSLGAALAAVAAVLVGVVRRWRMASVVLVAGVATGAMAGVALIPAFVDSSPAMSAQAAALSQAAPGTTAEGATDAGGTATDSPGAADAYPATQPTQTAAGPPPQRTTDAPAEVPTLPPLAAVLDPTALPVVGLIPPAGECSPITPAIAPAGGTGELTGALSTTTAGLTAGELPVAIPCVP